MEDEENPKTDEETVVGKALVGVGTGAVLVVVLGGGFLFGNLVGDGVKGAYRRPIVETVPAKDLNGDGLDDMVAVSESGYKTPLYKIKDGRYVVASELEKDEAVPVDYETIEKKLNEKDKNGK